MVLERCKAVGITLHRKKAQFAQPSVEWCGYTLYKVGYFPREGLVNAPTYFPWPLDKGDVRSFCGLVQQFKAYLHANVAASANSFRDWINRRKSTLDKLTPLATTRPSQMLCDNIREQSQSPKQSAEGGLDTDKVCILGETDPREHTKWTECSNKLEKILADALTNAASPSPRSKPPCVLTPLYGPYRHQLSQPRPCPGRSIHDGLLEAADAVP